MTKEMGPKKKEEGKVFSSRKRKYVPRKETKSEETAEQLLLISGGK